MGTKRNPGKHDCYASAEPDEPMFVLLARDPLAPELVRRWARRRKLTRGPSDKVHEAETCAAEMERWAFEHAVERKPAPSVDLDRSDLFVLPLAWDEDMRARSAFGYQFGVVPIPPEAGKAGYYLVQTCLADGRVEVDDFPSTIAAMEEAQERHDEIALKMAAETFGLLPRWRIDAVAAVDAAYPDAHWLLAKGRESDAQPLHGFRIVFGPDDIVVDGAGESISEAVTSALENALAARKAAKRPMKW